MHSRCHALVIIEHAIKLIDGRQHKNWVIKLVQPALEKFGLCQLHNLDYCCCQKEEERAKWSQKTLTEHVLNIKDEDVLSKHNGQLTSENIGYST